VPIVGRFNAAELISIQARKNLGMHITSFTLQPRQIQQFSWLDINAR